MKTVSLFYFLAYWIFLNNCAFAQSYPYTHVVSNVGDPTIFTNEPSVAAYGNHVVVGCNYNNWNEINTVGAFYSSDKGSNWHQSQISTGFNGNSIDDSDPAVAFDGVGNVYFAYLSVKENGQSGIFINKSTDFGETWLEPIPVVTRERPSELDKPYIYIKKDLLLSENIIFITFTEFYNNEVNEPQVSVNIIRASAADLIFSNSVIVATVPQGNTHNDVQSAIPYVTPSGKLYVVYIEKNNVDFSIKIRRSDNLGYVFGPIISIRDNFSHIGYLNPSSNRFVRGTSSKNFRVNSFPSITSIEEKIYVAWAEKSLNIDKVKISTSDDYGINWNIWSGELSPTPEIFPWITHTADNKLIIIYYSTSDINTLNLDAGCKLLKNDLSVEDIAFEPLFSFNVDNSFSNLPTPFVGDYLNVTATDDMIYGVFTSNINISNSWPTVIKCSSIPNSVNIAVDVYYDDEPSEYIHHITIDNNPITIEPLRTIIYDESYTHNAINFAPQDDILNELKFRNWTFVDQQYQYNNPLILPYGTPLTISDPLRLNYYPATNVTVTNYLETLTPDINLTGGSYRISWNYKPNDYVDILSGQNYLALLYVGSRLDEYNVTFPPYLLNDWYFLRWEDESASIPRNLQILQPTNLQAYFKGHLRSNSPTAFNTNQKKVINNSNAYFSYYESLGKIWETTSEGGNDWNPEIDISTKSSQLLDNATYKNPSCFITPDTLYLVFEYKESGSNTAYICVVRGRHYDQELFINHVDFVDSYDASYFGNANPVIASIENPYEIFVLYKKSDRNGIYYINYNQTQGTSWAWGQAGLLDWSSGSSKDINVLPDYNFSDNAYHVIYEDKLT